MESLSCLTAPTLVRDCPLCDLSLRESDYFGAGYNLWRYIWLNLSFHHQTGPTDWSGINLIGSLLPKSSASPLGTSLLMPESVLCWRSSKARF